MVTILDRFPARRASSATAVDCTISVVPVSGGWSVQLGALAAPQLFLSGAKAEKKANVVAERLARAGADVRVEIHDRSGALVGTRRYFAPSHAADLPGGAGGHAPPQIALRSDDWGAREEGRVLEAAFGMGSPPRGQNSMTT